LVGTTPPLCDPPPHHALALSTLFRDVAAHQAINSEYQRWTFNLNYLDSISKVRKKEEAKQQLQQLERMTSQLSVVHVFLHSP